jgi:hypothetical protein
MQGKVSPGKGMDSLVAGVHCPRPLPTPAENVHRNLDFFAVIALLTKKIIQIDD